MNSSGVLQDLRYTFRTLGRNPGFTLFVILIAGLGIGASSTVFSVVNALLMRPLPFERPQQLVWITNRNTSGLSGQTTQVNHFLDLRAQNRSFTDVAAYFAFYGVGDNKLTGSGQPERLSGVPVTENFFQLLGVKPQIGRLFTPEECKFNGPKAALLSDGLWRRRFNSDRSLVGRTLTLNNEPVTVVGVLPASFDFSSVFAPGSKIDLYVPFPLSDQTNRWGNTLAIVARLKPGVTAEAAQAEVRVLGEQFSNAHPERNRFEGNLTLLHERVSGRLRPAVFVLALAVGAVMLIVCANLSNLLLVRTAARHRELAVRTALGAGTRRLVRQMMTESITLSCCGAGVGLLLAWVGTRILASLDAISIPLLHSVHLDAVAIAFTAGMAILAGIIFGIAPALQVPTARLHDALKENSRGNTNSKHWGRIRNGLVVAEIAFACVLLVAAGLLVRSFLRVLDVNLGFQPSMAAAIRVDPDKGFRTLDAANAYFDDVLRRVKDVPGIEAAGLTDVLPLGRNRSWGAGVKGQSYPKGQYPTAYPRIVSEGYLGVMGIPLRTGRDFNARDSQLSEPVMLINETMAKRLFPAGDALNGRIGVCGAPRRIIGVVGDVRHLALEEGAGMEMYLPMRQCSDLPSIDLVIRSAMPPAQLASAVRAALRPVDPNLAAGDFRVLQTLVDKAVSPRRFLVVLLGGFATFALILASLGIYGVISYSVNQRTQEIGIRMALGASAGSLQRRILGQTLLLAAAGLTIGLAGSWMLARALSDLLYEVTPGDPVTFAGIAVVLIGVAALAGYLPARRASRIDPMTALRAE